MDAALLNLRAEIVRDSLDGLEHVDALLAIRGVEPEPVPRKVPKHFKRGELRTAILRILRERPQTGPEIAKKVAARKDGMAYKQAYICTYRTLCRLKATGMVVLRDRAWGLA